MRLLLFQSANLVCHLPIHIRVSVADLKKRLKINMKIKIKCFKSITLTEQEYIDWTGELLGNN